MSAAGFINDADAALVCTSWAALADAIALCKAELGAIPGVQQQGGHRPPLAGYFH